MSRLSNTVRLLLAGFCIGIAGVGAGWADEGLTVVVNPYECVDWDTVEHHKAALHVHTLQSDGHHMLEEVVEAYRDAGFTILAITDHDNMEPNRHVPARVPEEQASPYPKDPKPEDYPANTTWPWPQYGGPAPEEVGMVGIEGNEFSYRHHINSLYNDFGAPDDSMDEDELLFEVRNRNGLAFFDHPATHGGWSSGRPVEWYAERFAKHGPEYLVGIEVTNSSPEIEKYDEGLWDQLLARFMPDRPIWGFGTDDMHSLASVRESHSVFPLDELSDEAVRAAMEKGQFYLRKSSRRNDFRERRPAEELFPLIEAIEVDNEAGTITVHASNYDTIQWISAPESLEPVADHQESTEPWPLGRVVHEGESIHFRDTPHVARYLRIELQREDGEDVFRTFTNSFGLGSL